MGLIGIIKPLTTVLSIAILKSKQHHEKNSLESQESNPRLLGQKQGCLLCAVQPANYILIVCQQKF